MKRTEKLIIEEGGCSAKFSPVDLHDLMRGISTGVFPDLIVGKDNFDDAAVWSLKDGNAVIQTVDFFPALCEEPYYFGQIAAANSVSDIYAMGAVPKFALNIVMFPSDLDKREMLNQILKGGADKLKEADVALAGGHTIKDDIPKYGLTVTGLCKADNILKNKEAKAGEKIILTKALGTGIALAGRKLGELSEDNYMGVINSMRQLNNITEILHKYNVKCATDITGFGLIGHSLEIAKASDVYLKLNSKKLPVLSGVRELLDIGCMPCALFNNLKSFENSILFEQELDYNIKMLCFDAQTSGGILFTCKEECVDEILFELRSDGFEKSTIIGDVVKKNKIFYINLK